MILHSKVYGDSDRDLIILHGLYSSLDSWLIVGKTLSLHFRVHLLDLRNHGKSFHNNSHSYLDMVEDVRLYVEEKNIKKFSLIGHSMGGKVAMFFAKDHPKLLEKLVVVDISPRSYTSLVNNNENANFHLNLISFLRNMELSNFKTFDEIGRFLDSSDKITKSIVLKNLKKKKNVFSWKINLDAIFNNLDKIMSGLNIDDFSQNKIKTQSLFIKAENSDYIQEKDREIISFIFSNSEVVEISNAGHRLSFEKPDELVSVIINYFNR